MSDYINESANGWQRGKFLVRHYRRGDLIDGEAFVLVPERDPAAVQAIRAYSRSTTDPELAERLTIWMDEIEGESTSVVTVDDRIPGWVLSLASAVWEGQMDIDTALYRLAGLLKVENETLPEV